MDISKFGWTRKEQEVKTGDYHFSGRILMTATVQEHLEQEVIQAIVFDALKFAKEQNGIDYLLVYLNAETGEKLFFIDESTKAELQSGQKPQEYNYATLMFAEDY